MVFLWLVVLVGVGCLQRYVCQCVVWLCIAFPFSVNVQASDFFTLVTQGDVEAVEAVLTTRFVSLEQRNDEGDTPLLFAARSRHFEMFDLLVRHGANINVLAGNDRDILNLSVRLSSPELAKKALAAGIYTGTFTPRYQGSALIFASAEGEAEIVEAILKAGAPINRRNNLGWTALQEAVILGDGSEVYQRIIRSLLMAGADKTMVDNNGNTPLNNAKDKGQLSVAALLQSGK